MTRMRDKAAEDLIMLRVKIQNLEKRNARAHHPDDDATAALEQAAEVVALAEATEKRVSTSTTALDSVKALVEASKRATGAVHDAARMMKDRGANKRGAKLQAIRAREHTNLMVAKSKLATLRTGDALDDPGLAGEVEAAMQQIRVAENLFGQCEEHRFSKELTDAFAESVPRAVELVAQATENRSRLKTLEEMEHKVHTFTERLKTVREQANDLSVESVAPSSGEPEHDMVPLLEELTSSHAAAEQAAEAVHSSVYDPDLVTRLQQTVLLAEGAARAARKKLDQIISDRAAQENEALNRQVSSKMEELARLRAVVRGTHELDSDDEGLALNNEDTNEADEALARLEAASQAVGGNPAENKRKAAEFVALMAAFPTILKRTQRAVDKRRAIKRKAAMAKMEARKATAAANLAVCHETLARIEKPADGFPAAKLDTDTQKAVNAASAAMLEAKSLAKSLANVDTTGGHDSDLAKRFFETAAHAKELVGQAALRVDSSRREAAETIERHKIERDKVSLFGKVKFHSHHLDELRERAKHLDQTHTVHGMLNKAQLQLNTAAEAQKQVEEGSASDTPHRISHLRTVTAELDKHLEKARTHIDEHVIQMEMETAQVEVAAHGTAIDGLRQTLNMLQSTYDSTIKSPKAGASTDNATTRAMARAQHDVEAALKLRSQAAKTHDQSKLRVLLRQLGGAVQRARTSVDAASTAVDSLELSTRREQLSKVRHRVSHSHREVEAAIRLVDSIKNDRASDPTLTSDSSNELSTVSRTVSQRLSVTIESLAAAKRLRSELGSLRLEDDADDNALPSIDEEEIEHFIHVATEASSNARALEEAREKERSIVSRELSAARKNQFAAALGELHVAQNKVQSLAGHVSATAPSASSVREAIENAQKLKVAAETMQRSIETADARDEQSLHTMTVVRLLFCCFVVLLVVGC